MKKYEIRYIQKFVSLEEVEVFANSKDKAKELAMDGVDESKFINEIKEGEHEFVIKIIEISA